MQDEFNELTAIETAQSLQEMVGVDISVEDLREKYEGADDEMILRIIDTLHIYRFDWMDQAPKALGELLERTDDTLHMQVLKEAQDLAFMRLKHIGFLQQSGQYLKDLEEDILREGQDRFPELYDASNEAEAKTKQAIVDVAVMIDHVSKHLDQHPSYCWNRASACKYPFFA